MKSEDRVLIDDIKGETHLVGEESLARVWVVNASVVAVTTCLYFTVDFVRVHGTPPGVIFEVVGFNADQIANNSSRILTYGGTMIVALFAANVAQKREVETIREMQRLRAMGYLASGLSFIFLLTTVVSVSQAIDNISQGRGYGIDVVMFSLLFSFMACGAASIRVTTYKEKSAETIRNHLKDLVKPFVQLRGQHWRPETPGKSVIKIARSQLDRVIAVTTIAIMPTAFGTVFSLSATESVVLALAIVFYSVVFHGAILFLTLSLMQAERGLPVASILVGAYFTLAGVYLISSLVGLFRVTMNFQLDLPYKCTLILGLVLISASGLVPLRALFVRVSTLPAPKRGNLVLTTRAVHDFAASVWWRELQRMIDLDHQMQERVAKAEPVISDSNRNS